MNRKEIIEFENQIAPPFNHNAGSIFDACGVEKIKFSITDYISQKPNTWHYPEKMYIIIGLYHVKKRM